MSESSSRGENFPEQQFPRLSLLPLSGARVLVFPPGDGQGRVGLGRTRHKSQFPPPPASPPPSLSKLARNRLLNSVSPPQPLRGWSMMGGEVGALPMPYSGCTGDRLENAEKVHLRGIYLPARSGCCCVLCKYLKTLASWLYNKLRKCRHVSKLIPWDNYRQRGRMAQAISWGA